VNRESLKLTLYVLGFTLKNTKVEPLESYLRFDLGINFDSFVFRTVSYFVVLYIYMKSLLKLLVVFVITWQAKLVLRKYKPKIVAVTGSVGKTTAKDAIFSVLSSSFFVRKSEKSFNTEIGVPLTILGQPNGWKNPFAWIVNIIEGFALLLLPNHYPKILVLEAGAERPGDIERLTSWLKPDVAVITRLAKVPVHVEFFSGPEDVYREKSVLIKELKSNGTAVLNSDDEDILPMRDLTTGKIVLYGTMPPAEVIASGYKIEYEGDGKGRAPVGVSFDVSIGKEFENILIRGGLGVQQMYPILSAIAVGKAMGLSLEKIAKSLGNHETTKGRMKIVGGLKNTLIIDDTYNSSPLALEEALNTLHAIRTRGRKIAVLGDMLELGVFSTPEHKKAGEHAAKVVNKLFTVGVRARHITEGALMGGLPENDILQFEDSKRAGKELELMLAPGDVVLVKGSQGIRMERVMEEIMAEPERKDELLVRQDREWLRR